MTVINRLKMELGHKPYCGDDEYITFLAEHNLTADDEYEKGAMQRNLLETVISILEMLANNIDNYMRIETNFHTTSAALENLHKRINHIGERIGNIKESSTDNNGENNTEKNAESDFSFMYHSGSYSRFR